jgi:hypothetical protein
MPCAVRLQSPVTSHQRRDHPTPVPAVAPGFCMSFASCSGANHVARRILYKPLQVRVRGGRPSKLVAIGINDALRFTDQDYFLLAAFKPAQVLRRADLDAPKPVAAQWPFVVFPSTQASRRLGGVAFTILRCRLASKSTATALLGLNRATRALADVVRPQQPACARC